MSKKKNNTNTSINNNGLLAQIIIDSPEEKTVEDTLKKVLVGYESIPTNQAINADEYLIMTTPDFLNILKDLGHQTNERIVSNTLIGLGYNWVTLFPPLFRHGVYWVFKKVNNH